MSWQGLRWNTYYFIPSFMLALGRDLVLRGYCLLWKLRGFESLNEYQNGFAEVTPQPETLKGHLLLGNRPGTSVYSA